MSPLRRRRLQLGVSQWALARRTGVSVSKLSFAERGLRLLSRAEQRVLAEALAAELTELFDEEPAQ